MWITWLGKLPTCRRHVGPTAKSWHIWPTGPRRADTNLFPTLFFVSGIADFLQIFSKYQSYIQSNHRTNWYVLNNPLSQVTFFHPSHIMVTALRATTASTTQRRQWRRRDGRRSKRWWQWCNEQRRRRRWPWHRCDRIWQQRRWRRTLSLHKNIVTSINARNNWRLPPILQPLSFCSLSQKIRRISIFAASHKTCCRLCVTLYCKLHTAMFLHNHIPHPPTTQQPT